MRIVWTGFIITMFDLSTLGSMGYVPGWLEMDVYPPQQMIAQTRSVLDAYANEGGECSEDILADTGNGVFIEKPDEFRGLFHEFLVEHL